MGLGAVQDLLELFVTRFLGLHSHLQEETRFFFFTCLRHPPVSLHVDKKQLKMDLKDFFAHTSRMVISFSFSFPALFLTCVFLVSTHTTLSFTSDLHTHKHTNFIHLQRIAVLKTPHTESRLTLGCPSRPVLCPGRGKVGAPGRAAPRRAASPTWGSPTPAQRALSFHAARGSPCLLGNPVPRRPAPHPPPPPCFVSRPPPAWLSDRYLKKE